MLSITDEVKTGVSVYSLATPGDTRDGNDVDSYYKYTAASERGVVEPQRTFVPRLLHQVCSKFANWWSSVRGQPAVSRRNSKQPEFDETISLDTHETLFLGAAKDRASYMASSAETAGTIKDNHQNAIRFIRNNVNHKYFGDTVNLSIRHIVALELPDAEPGKPLLERYIKLDTCKGWHVGNLASEPVTIRIKLHQKYVILLTIKKDRDYHRRGHRYWMVWQSGYA